MKKILDKVMTMSADAALEAALAAVGFASHAGSYQPEEPETLENLKKSKLKFYRAGFKISCSIYHFLHHIKQMLKPYLDFFKFSKVSGSLG